MVIEIINVLLNKINYLYNECWELLMATGIFQYSKV